MQIIISAILTAVLLIWSRDLLMLFGASRKSIEYAVSYMNIYAVGTIFVELTLGMNAFITAQGFAKTGMLSVLIVAISNIILDPIFIFGFGMGVKGAALATIISQALSCIWVISFLMGRKTMLKIRKENLLLRPKIIFPCLALGAATFVKANRNHTFARLHNERRRSQCQTRKNNFRAKEQIFFSDLQMACQMTFNALGRAVESIVVAVMRKFILLLPLIYIMPLLFSSNKTMAVYLAEPAADLLAVTFTAILFTVRFKKALQTMENKKIQDT